MTDDRLAEQQMAEGFLGTSPDELEKLSDAELASWQSHIPAGLPQHILAEKEWQRRIAIRQLREQFKLEEKIANGNRWWGMAAAVVGVIGTLSGVWLGKHLEPSALQATAQQAQTQAASPAASPQTQPSSASTSASSSTTSQPVKKAK